MLGPGGDTLQTDAGTVEGDKVPQPRGSICFIGHTWHYRPLAYVARLQSTAVLQLLRPAFYHGRHSRVFADIQINFGSTLWQAGGKYTYGEHKYWTPTPERLGPRPASSVTPSVTAIRDGCLCTLLPRLRPAWLWDAGAAVENNYFRITIGGHLQRRFTVPTAAVTGRRRRDAKHAVTAKASKPKSERVVNSGNSPASCSVISLKDSLAVICKSPAKCSAQHFPPPRRVALQEHNWNYLIGMLPSR